jgi:hypothetical protein
MSSSRVPVLTTTGVPHPTDSWRSVFQITSPVRALNAATNDPSVALPL